MKLPVNASLVLYAITATALPAQNFTTLFAFDGANGARSGAAPIQATDGNLYGTAIERGANGLGTVFKIGPRGDLTTLYDFCSHNGCPDGVTARWSMTQATDRDLYGTTYYGGANHEGSAFQEL
jgi:uncharacterized repeat protein (TIGR03803 family)